MHELRPGLWHWTVRHPEWTDEDDTAGHGWGPEISCYAYDADDRVVLIDPAIPDGGLDELLRGRDAVTVLTCPWHTRDARALGLPVYAPPPEQDDREPATATYAAGDTLPFGIAAFPGLEPFDLVLWIERHRALVFGDTLVDLGDGLELPDDWGPGEIPHAPVFASLRERLQLPIELALPTHGPPADRAAFERALARETQR
jgi:glyoxylase-like metal-dependent hydrolase (beta-lactamase superfamily II)